MVKRETSSLASVAFLLVSLPLLLAQDPQTQSSPVLPSDILGPQLIVWSQVQKPQPVPQPLPPADQTGSQPDRQQANPPAQPPAAVTLMGTIVKVGTGYVLKVSSNSAYQLDDQEKASQYEGKQVRIAASLDASGKVLHITSIELVS
jgi:hypothetical protein